ncbi:MAG TPA: terminase small subunit [Stellaceae bacterium]|nr:terminase small subunit [Stellaceae bacterium]
MSSPLTPRERRFVAEYARLRNAKQAALNAGYAPRWAQMLGSRILHKPHIVAALAAAGVAAPRGPHPRTQIRQPASRLRRGLTPRQQRFVEEYLVCGNASEAARRIGLSAKNARANGYRLARRPMVAAAIKAAQERSARRTAISADRVRDELAALAFSDIRDFADWDATHLRVRSAKDIDPQDRAAIAELRIKHGKNGGYTRLRLYPKLAALEALSRHLGISLKNGGRPPAAYARAAEAEEAAKRAADDAIRERLARIKHGGKDGEGNGKP